MTRPDPWFLANSLIIPPLAAAASVVALLLQLAHRYAQNVKREQARQNESVGVTGQSASDAKSILRLRMIRVMNTLFLFLLTVVLSASSRQLPEGSALGVAGTYAYASCIGVLSVASREPLASLFRRHLSCVLFVAWAVYVYRDIWPLATYTLQPADAAEGLVLWIGIAALTVASVIVPLIIPRVYAPSESVYLDQETSLAQTASLLSLVTYSFMDETIWKAHRMKHLPFDQLPPLVHDDHTRAVVQWSFPSIDPFRTKKSRHLLYGLFELFRGEYAWLSVLLLFRIVTRFAGPIGIYRLLEYLQNRGEDAVIRPWVWIVCLFFGPLVSTMCMQYYIFILTRLLVRAQAMLTQLVFNHALRVRATANPHSDDKNPRKDTQSTGKMFNLATTDVNNLLEGREFLQILFAPFQVTLSMIFLYRILGWSAIVGLVTIVALAFLPGYLSSLLRETQRKKMAKTDSRIQDVTETMTIIRMIKLFAWENRVSDRIDSRREEELVYLRAFNVFRMVNDNVNYIIPVITMVATFVTYTVIMQQELTVSRVFSAMSVFDMIRDQIFTVSHLLPGTLQATVSLDRVNEYLQKTELLDEYSDAAVQTGHEDDVIGIRSASFAWSAAYTTTQDSPSFTLRVGGDLTFKRGQVNLVIGPTGSGKTALLLALLGEMHCIPNSSDSFVSLPRAGGVAYVPQEAWILSDSIRENILFGASIDETRYQQVIYQCGLQHDLALFEHGDMTEVGERGITLSGGQKARVSLARAVYSAADILLLDDIFAALDVHTARWIVEKCLKGELLHSRTIILVTHNLALVGSIAAFVVRLGRDGTIVAQGRWSEVCADGGIEEALEEPIVNDRGASEDTHEHRSATIPSKGTGTLVVSEEISEGHVGWSTMRLFLATSGGHHAILFWASVLSFIAASQIAGVAQTYWLGHWAQQYEIRDGGYVYVPYYLGIYIGFLLLDLALRWFGYLIYLIGTLRASRIIHKSLVDSVLRTTLRWLDRTPTSRIMARCTQDIQSIDGPLASTLNSLIYMTAVLLAKFAGVVAVAPIFSLLGAISAVLGGWCGELYMKAQMPVKREQSKARAPILGHLGTTLAGLVSIRAYGAQERFIDESFRKIDKYSRTTIVFFNLNRWVGLRIEALSASISALLAVYLVYGRHPQAATTGFALNMAVGFNGMVLWWIRAFNDTEVCSNSLERVEQYLNIEHEPKPIASGVPPAYWPASGSLRVEDLSAQYSPDGPRVLRNINFEVKAGEHVGIVGRTGSGKSSLALALLRLIPTEGHVYYDGIPTDSLNLDALRSSITIIPQIPELLSGTLRQNLDPFDEFNDAEMHDALRAAGLFSLSESRPSSESPSVIDGQTNASRITLDSQIGPGGSNLSVGQRQILALARAILRQSKLLILDEATSAIDFETDAVIQHSLREAVGKDVTVLTIAHRLQTIVDADKVLVLDSGRLAEFGAPADLLRNKDGLFTALVNESADAAALRAMAGPRS